MVHAKYYENMSTFVKVMQKKLWPLFFRTRCIMLVELGLPSFNTVLHNAAAGFNRRLGCSTNSLVMYDIVCNCSS